MKLNAFKIEGKTYFVSDAKLAKHKSLENAASAIKQQKENTVKPKRPKRKPKQTPSV